MYLTLDEIKKHLNLDSTFTDDDAYILSLADVAEVIVAKHIGRKLKDLEDEEGNIPSPLRHSMLIFIGNLYANRESVVFTSTSELPLSYRYLLELYENYDVWC